MRDVDHTDSVHDQDRAEYIQHLSRAVEKAIRDRRKRFPTKANLPGRLDALDMAEIEVVVSYVLDATPSPGRITDEMIEEAAQAIGWAARSNKSYREQARRGLEAAANITRKDTPCTS